MPPASDNLRPAAGLHWSGRSDNWSVLSLLLAGACGSGTTPTPTPPQPPAVATVEVTPNSGVIPLGSTLQLSATAKDAQGNTLQRPVDWSSSDATVATVSTTGLVTGIGPGTAVRITATCGGKAGTAAIDVRAATVASVIVSSDADTLLAIGRTTQLRAIAKDSQGQPVAGRAVAWSSANSTIATIGLSGLAMGVTAGRVTLSAEVDGIRGELAIVVGAVDVGAVQALAADPYLHELVANVSAASRAPILPMLNTLATAANGGNLAEVLASIASVRGAMAASLEQSDRPLFAVIGLFLDRIETLVKPA